MDIPNKVPYCVYHHIAEGDIFYVGCGLPMRPYQSSYRTAKWNDIASKHPDYSVSIVKTFYDLSEARSFEVAEIKRLSPVANTHHNPEKIRRVPENAMLSIRTRFPVYEAAVNAGIDWIAPRPPGRPRKPHDGSKARALVECGCSVRQVASILKLKHSTSQRIVRRIRDELVKEGKISS